MRRTRRPLAIVCGCALLIAVGVGIVGRLAGSPPIRSAVVPSPVIPSGGSAGPVDRFAAEVGAALFDWDTTADPDRSSVIDRVLRHADLLGQEAPGLLADLDAYIPSTDAWHQLREFDTRQHLEVTQVLVPDSWARVDTSRLPPGTEARTVHGVRHRAGVAFGNEAASQHPVQFTVFVVCPPPADQCALLRLSRPNEPLR